MGEKLLAKNKIDYIIKVLSAMSIEEIGATYGKPVDWGLKVPVNHRPNYNQGIHPEFYRTDPFTNDPDY